MKNGWQTKELKDVALVFNGNSISENEKKNKYIGLSSGVPYIGTKDVGFDHEIQYDSGVLIPPTATSKFKLAPSGSIFVCAEGGSAGRKIAHNSKPVYFGNKLYAICPKEILLPKFVFYYCIGDLFGASFRDGMSGLIGGVSLNKFKSIPISFPPIEEQRRIVAILDEAFACIDKAKANTKKNIQNARELFDSYLNNIFSNPGPDWVEKGFDEFCEISSMLVDPRLPAYQALTHVGAANIETKTGELSDLKTAKEEKLISGKFWFDESMVLYSKIRPYLMKVARPDFVGLCSADIYPLASKSGSINRDFLFYLLLSPEFTDYAISGSARAGMPKVNREHLFGYRCDLPPIREQEHIATKFDEISLETRTLENTFDEKVANLDELKKSILQKAFSNQL